MFLLSAVLIKSTSYLFLNPSSPLPLHLMSSLLMCGPHLFPLLMIFITTLFLLTISQSISSFIHYVVNHMFIPPFFAFKQLVENYFITIIKTLYTDNRGEFLTLRSFLATYGITHLTTPPHTPKHNGYSESQHRHNVKTGLTLLHQAFIPLTFWSYAFATTVYLIN